MEKINQVGGNHYANNKGFDVFDFADAYNLGAKEFSAVKYISRHGKKNGAEDVCKAIGCLCRVLTDTYNIEPNQDAVNLILKSYEHPDN